MKAAGEDFDNDGGTAVTAVFVEFGDEFPTPLGLPASPSCQWCNSLICSEAY